MVSALTDFNLGDSMPATRASTHSPYLSLRLLHDWHPVIAFTANSRTISLRFSVAGKAVIGLDTCGRPTM